LTGAPPLNALAIDTTSDVLSLALLREGRPAGALYARRGNAMARTLLTDIEALLSQAGLRPRDLGLLAVARGPGSFTGTRIGMSVALTMAQVHKAPLVGVDTLRILAGQTDPAFRGRFHVLLNCARDEVYHAPYRRNEDGRLEALAPVALAPLAEVVAGLLRERPGIPAVIRRFDPAQENLAPLLERLPRVPLARDFPDGECLLDAALPLFHAHGAGGLPRVEPVYLKSEAFRTWRPGHAAPRASH
jgi:tRNA threonylcarbamoyladenosine biosynthesis protein TsaB